MAKELEVGAEGTNSGTSNSPIWAIIVLARDVVCGIALILLACLIAGTLRQAIPIEYPDLYIIWFALSMIPFLLFAHWRGAVRITRGFAILLVPVLLIWPFVPMAAFDATGGSILYPLVCVCLFWLGERLTAWISPEAPRSKQRTE